MPAFRFRRAAAPLALAAALVATPFGRAGGQPAPCATGTLASYLTPGFRCLLGGFRVSRFDFGENSGTSGLDVTATTPDPDNVTLTPFEGVDAFGRSTFGFTLDNFFVRVEADGATDPDDGGAATAFLSFSLRTTDPYVRLAGAGLDATLRNRSTTGNVFTFSGLEGHVGRPAGLSLPDPPYCLHVHRELFDLGVRTPSPDEDCRRRLRRRARADYSLAAILVREDPSTATAISGTARVTLREVRFAAQVVPEPATVALVGGGLALLGVAARRRRA